MSKNFNTSGSNPNSGAGFSSWDTVRTQYEDAERAKAEEAARKAREKALAVGGKKFDARMNTLVKRNNQNAYEDYVNLHTRLHQYENNPSQEFTQEGEYKFAISDDTYTDTVKHNPYAKKLNVMAKRIASLPEGEVKQKYVDQFTALSVEYARNEDIKIMAPLDPSNENGRYKDVKHDFLDRAWAISYGESISEAEGSSEAKKEYTDIQKDGLSKLVKLRLEFMANGQDMDFAKAKEFYDRYHEIAYNSKLSNDEGTIEGFAPFMAKYKELSPTAKEAGFEEVEDEKPAPSPEANKSVETEKTKEKPVSRWRKIGKWVAGLGVGLALFGVFGNKKSEEVKPANNSQRVENVTKANTLEGDKSTENGAFNTDNATETQKGPEAREKLADNGQYDRAADPYFAHHKSVENMFDNSEIKESLESLGPDMADLTPEEFKVKFLSEDNPAGIQQILMTNQEVAGAFGLDYQSSEALFDAYRNDDQAAFAKVAEIRKAIAEHFMQEGTGSLEGVQFDSVYLQDINGDGSDLNFAHADNLNIGGTTRIVSFVINGNKYTIEIRDQCGGQIVLRDGTVIKLPPEFTRIDKPTPVPTPEPQPEPQPEPTPEPQPEPTPENNGKDRTLEDKGTYSNITVMDSGELTQETTKEEEDGSVDPNTQTGQNDPGVTVDGANGTETSNNLGIDVQYDGEITQEGMEQMLKNQYEAKIQQQQSQQAEEDKNIGYDGYTVDQIYEMVAREYERLNNNNQ